MSVDAAAQLLAELLRRSHLSAPADLPGIVADQARTIGAVGVDLSLIDYEMSTLLPLPAGPDDRRAGLPVTGTVAGRAYSSTTILESGDGRDGGRWLWLPLLDGTERLGVMAMSFGDAPPEQQTIAVCERYAHLVATLIVTKSAYSDLFDLVRRTQPRSIASELVWEMVPPLVFATDDLVVSAMLEPAYDNGGDVFDYALDDGLLHLAIFDAMGHGLAAAGLATFALSAYRNSRRRGLDLIETYNSMDLAIGEQFPGEGFVTALVAQMDVATGRLAWLSAGHPHPLVVRDDRRARALDAPPATPLGVPAAEAPVIARASLEPGDMLLLYTDGLTEARTGEDERLGVEGLRRFVEREAAGAQVAPETLRRLRHAIVATQGGRLDDDATAVLVEWRRGAERGLLPPTV